MFRQSWAYMFNNNSQVVSMVASVLPLVALFQVFGGLYTIIGAILRATGQQVC